MNTEIKIEDNGKDGKVILFEEDRAAGEVIFHWIDKSKFVLAHTIVDKAFGGKGYGKILVMETAAYAKKNAAKIIPECSYARALFDKTESLKDIEAK